MNCIIKDEEVSQLQEIGASLLFNCSVHGFVNREKDICEDIDRFDGVAKKIKKRLRAAVARKERTKQ